VERRVRVELYNLAVSDIGKLAMSLVDAATIVVGTSTVLAGPHSLAAYAAFLANALRPKAKFLSIIGSYGWGGKTVETLAGMIPNLKVEVFGSRALERAAVGERFVVMAGCDGRQKARSYFTEVAENLPKNTVILTAGCAKYRYNKLNLGDIGGIPRILDAGQCNDSYSLAVIALKLKEAFGLKDINELPVSYDIAWYEQKAVAVLLALLYLGVQGMRLGPMLPAFLSPNVAKVMVDKFNIKPIGTVQEDIAATMAGK
jgi:hydroxylamine reductase